MLAVMIVPTGIGAEIGGHAGDANPAARLLGAAVDQLIVHPNIVNASDINEMPANALYVEGSLLDDFLAGQVNLRPVMSNKILVACNELLSDTMNVVSAARATLGVEVEIIILDHPLSMTGTIENGKASGHIYGDRDMLDQLRNLEFDALAIHTPVIVSEDVVKEYLTNGGVNPWGGVEAMLSRTCGRILGKPLAHAPVETMPELDQVVEPRLAAEMVGTSHLYSVLKGLHKAPKPIYMTKARAGDLSVDDVDVVVSAVCWDTPHWICEEKDIPIIFVIENKTVIEAAYVAQYSKHARHVFVENYLEAAGLLLAMRNGISRESVIRPLQPNFIHER